jgi:hypothetical protein
LLAANIDSSLSIYLCATLSNLPTVDPARNKQGVPASEVPAKLREMVEAENALVRPVTS